MESTGLVVHVVEDDMPSADAHFHRPFAVLPINNLADIRRRKLRNNQTFLAEMIQK